MQYRVMPKGSGNPLIFFENVVLPFAKHLSQNCVGGVIERIPKPSLVSLATHIKPLLVEFGFESCLKPDFGSVPVA